eukprot:jgi/Mesen1/11066/ME000099S10517
MGGLVSLAIKVVDGLVWPYRLVACWFLGMWWSFLQAMASILTFPLRTLLAARREVKMSKNLNLMARELDSMAATARALQLKLDQTLVERERLRSKLELALHQRSKLKSHLLSALEQMREQEMKLQQQAAMAAARQGEAKSAKQHHPVGHFAGGDTTYMFNDVEESLHPVATAGRGDRQHEQSFQDDEGRKIWTNAAAVGEAETEAETEGGAMRNDDDMASSPREEEWADRLDDETTMRKMTKTGLDLEQNWQGAGSLSASLCMVVAALLICAVLAEGTSSHLGHAGGLGIAFLLAKLCYNSLQREDADRGAYTTTLMLGLAWGMLGALASVGLRVVLPWWHTGIFKIATWMVEISLTAFNGDS